MQIKVQCPCGARFEFPVEPVQGRMPVNIACPVCGADATELANEIIRRQNPTSPAVQAGLKIARESYAPGTLAADPPAPTASGYVPRPVPQRARRDPRQRRPGKYLAWAVGTLVVAAVGFWGWYNFGRHPKVVFSVTYPKTGPAADEFYQLLAPGQLFYVKDRHATLRDLVAGTNFWSVALPDSPETALSAYTDDAFPAPPQVIATANDLWLSFHYQFAHFNRHTGATKDTDVSGRVLNVAADDNAILVLTAADGHQSLTRISLPGATTQTEDVAAPVRAAAPRPAARTATTPAPDPDATPDAAPMNRVRTALLPAGSPGNPVATTFAVQSQPFIPAGSAAVQFQTALLESKTVTREAMKPKGKSVLDSGGVNASQGLDLAQEMMNDSQRERTGGVETEDVSRYRVTVHRQFAKDAPDWTGEVVGPPEFVALKNVDLVAGGRAIVALDRDNRKLWDANLTFQLPLRSALPDGRMPCLETGDTIYVADKGILTAFEPATGTVRWRLNSVGITAVQADARGSLYVDTAGADPEALKFSQQVDIRAKGSRFILKVDPKSGKVLWRSEVPATYYHALLSGPFIYAARDWQTQDPLRLEEGPDHRFSLSLRNPANGEMVWIQLRVNHPAPRIEVQQNWILLQYNDQLQVMKFFHL